MDLSEAFYDIWSAHYLNYGDYPAPNNEPIEPISSPELPQFSSLSLESLLSVSSNCVENYPTDSAFSTSLTFTNDSNEKPCEIKEFSEAIDSYFSSYYQIHDITETDPQPISNPNSVEPSSTSLTCYNSCFNSSLDSSTSFNSSPPIDSIDILNSNPKHQNIRVEPSECKKIMLAKDCSKIQEPWVPSVAKKLLASYYSPLSMKSELLSNQISLDAFESVALQEAVQAFSDIAFANPYCDSDLARETENDFYSDPRPIELVYSCEKLRAYRKLDIEDKMHLLARAFFDVNTVKGVITYDETIDGWYTGGKIWPRSAISWESPNASKVLNMIETFPDCFRNDLNVVALLYLIVIFNPDLRKLKFRNGIRQEQYIYIYLLKRYLISLFESTCEASDYHYRLMVKIEQAIKLPETVIFEQIQLGSTKVLKSRVIELIQHKSITIGNTGNLNYHV